MNRALQPIKSKPAQIQASSAWDLLERFGVQIVQTMLWPRLPWLAVTAVIAVTVVTAEELDFSCKEHEVELWEDVRLQLEKLMPRFAGRLSFAPWKCMGSSIGWSMLVVVVHHVSRRLNSGAEGSRRRYAGIGSEVILLSQCGKTLDPTWLNVV